MHTKKTGRLQPGFQAVHAFMQHPRAMRRVQRDVISIRLYPRDFTDRYKVHGVKFRPETSAAVRGDAGALEQMFLNLLLNAAEAGDAGSTVDVTIRQLPSNTEVRIRDRGIGMPAELLMAVGTPLRTTKPQGTGLGLSIARRIAEAHGGTLAVDSESSIGTTVTVSLPRAEPPPEPAFAGGTVG